MLTIRWLTFSLLLGRSQARLGINIANFVKISCWHETVWEKHDTLNDTSAIACATHCINNNYESRNPPCHGWYRQHLAKEDDGSKIKNNCEVLALKKEELLLAKQGRKISVTKEFASNEIKPRIAIIAGRKVADFDPTTNRTVNDPKQIWWYPTGHKTILSSPQYLVWQRESFFDQGFVVCNRYVKSVPCHYLPLGGNAGWQPLAKDMPKDAHNRYFYSLVPVTGKLWLIGGQYETGKDGPRSTYLFTWETGWYNGPTMPEKICRFNADKIEDHEVFIHSGVVMPSPKAKDRRCYSYSFLHQRWTDRQCPLMHVQYGGASGVVMIERGNGTTKRLLLLAGGKIKKKFNKQNKSYLQVYDIDHDTWSIRGEMPWLGANLLTGVGLNERFFIFGFYHAGGHDKFIQEYDFENDRWELIHDFGRDKWGAHFLSPTVMVYNRIDDINLKS